MKVGFIAPLSIAAVNGGVRTQAHQTAQHLENLGVEVEFISPWQTSLDVDLVHIFTASPETLGILKRCAGLGVKTALSPVFFSNKSAKELSLALKLEKQHQNLVQELAQNMGLRLKHVGLLILFFQILKLKQSWL